MTNRNFLPAAAAALALLLPLSLSGSDALFYQCTDEQGAVFFKSSLQRGDDRCLRLGGRQERRALDEKVKKYFAEPAASAPAFRANVIQNGAEGLRSFRRKLNAGWGARPVTIYFVGDSHLLSGDLIRGFLDQFELNHQVAECVLCTHQAKKVWVKKVFPGSKKPRLVLQLPKDYPQSAPRTCLSLLEQGTAVQQARAVRQPVQLASLFALGSSGGRGNNQLRVNVAAYAIGGKTFQYFAASALLEKDLLQYRPDLIVVMLGTNDAFNSPEPETVKRDVEGFIASVRRAAPISEILFIGPPDSFFKDGRENEYINVVRRGLQTESEKQGFGFWDLYTVMGGHGSMAKWQERGLSQKDKIHFLADGYMIVGRLFYQALVQ